MVEKEMLFIIFFRFFTGKIKLTLTNTRVKYTAFDINLEFNSIVVFCNLSDRNYAFGVVHNLHHVLRGEGVNYFFDVSTMALVI